MGKKLIDRRVRTLVENGVIILNSFKKNARNMYPSDYCPRDLSKVGLRQRTLFVLVGDRGRDQIVNLHYMLSKSAVKARPSVLWCKLKRNVLAASSQQVLVSHTLTISNIYPIKLICIIGKISVKLHFRL